jgi:hypothetical protein
MFYVVVRPEVDGIPSGPCEYITNDGSLTSDFNKRLLFESKDRAVKYLVGTAYWDYGWIKQESNNGQ